LLEPLLLFAITLIGNLIVAVILPIVLVSNVLGIIANISDRVQIGKLAKFMKSGIVWFLGVIIVGFVSALSVGGGLTSNVDGITARSVKSAAGTFIPVVRQSTSANLLIWYCGAASILKNGVGVVGIIIILGVVAMPIIKLATLTIAYHFLAAVCEPLADKKIISLLEQMGSTFKILLGIMFFIGALLIIGLAMTIRISNSVIMYR